MFADNMKCPHCESVLPVAGSEIRCEGCGIPWVRVGDDLKERNFAFSRRWLWLVPFFLVLGLGLRDGPRFEGLPSGFLVLGAGVAATCLALKQRVVYLRFVWRQSRCMNPCFYWIGVALYALFGVVGLAIIWKSL